MRVKTESNIVFDGTGIIFVCGKSFCHHCRWRIQSRLLLEDTLPIAARAAHNFLTVW